MLYLPRHRVIEIDISLALFSSDLYEPLLHLHDLRPLKDFYGFALLALSPLLPIPPPPLSLSLSLAVVRCIALSLFVPLFLPLLRIVFFSIYISFASLRLYRLSLILNRLTICVPTFLFFTLTILQKDFLSLHPILDVLFICYYFLLFLFYLLSYFVYQPLFKNISFLHWMIRR